VYPAHDGGVDDRETALGHHLRQIAVAKFEAQVPPYAQDDDLTVKVAPHKQVSQSQEPNHSPASTSSLGPRVKAHTVCIRAHRATLSLQCPFSPTVAATLRQSMMQRRKVFVSALSFAFPRPAGGSRVSMLTVMIRQISS
jgi:hypothetical protein